MKSLVSLKNPTASVRLFFTTLVIMAMVSGCSKKTPAPVTYHSSVITVDASSISYTGAASGGIVTSEGNDSIIQKGICYKMSAAPTIADSVIISTGVSDSFACNMLGLSPNTEYFVRSFIKTGKGISYGNQILFKTIGGATSGGSIATRIYLSGGYTNDVFAIDAPTGKVLWDKKVNATYCSSAAYSNGTIIVRGDNNTLTAFDTSGNVTWTRTLDGTQNDLRLIPVLIHNGMMYCRDATYTYAINSGDGSLKWKSANPNPNSSGDGPLTYRDGTLYTRLEYLSLYAQDAETGNLKWTLDGYRGELLVTSNLVYLFDMESVTTIYAIDPSTGKINWTSNGFPLGANGLVNAGNGRIYSTDGWVIDSASISASSITVLPSMQFNSGAVGWSGSYPQGSVYPVLADGLALSPAGVCDAMTGSLICNLPGIQTGIQGFCGGSYLNHVYYYTTGQYEVINLSTGNRYYSDLYAYDVIAKKMLWDIQFLNTDIYDVEPCIVDQFGNNYRGAGMFR